MKRIILFLLFLSSCASIDKKIDIAHPNEYGLSEEYNDKTFSIYCEGNTLADARFVDQECKKNISEFVHQKGYELFSVIKQDSDKKKNEMVEAPMFVYSDSDTHSRKHVSHGRTSSLSYIPYRSHSTTTQYIKNYVFVLIKDNEKKKYSNYYKVSDYYTPEQP